MVLAFDNVLQSDSSSFNKAWNVVFLDYEDKFSKSFEKDTRIKLSTDFKVRDEIRKRLIEKCFNARTAVVLKSLKDKVIDKRSNSGDMAMSHRQRMRNLCSGDSEKKDVVVDRDNSSDKITNKTKRVKRLHTSIQVKQNLSSLMEEETKQQMLDV